MNDYVEATLRHWRAAPFQWGSEDCLMSIANYLRPVIDWDIGERFRGKYNTEYGAISFIDEHGGEFNLLNHSQLLLTQKPERGDIALVAINSDRPIGGIITGEGVAVRLKRGVVEINLRFVKILHAWSVPKWDR